MAAGAPFERDPQAPLDLLIRDGRPPPRMREARCLRFEFTSRGDRVPARLVLPPDATGPFPVVLLQHGAGGSKEAEYLDVAAAPWVERGAAIASVDFPLHGERISPKLSERIAFGATGVDDDDLRIEFVRQAVIDLQRALDALERIPQIDAGRTAYAGFSLGTILGTIFCACDPRPRAAALAIGGGGFGPPGFDPVTHVARISPRPVLFVNAIRDQTIPRAAAEALHAAAGDPKEILWCDCSHTDLPGKALKSMWSFLARHLDLAAA